MLGPAVLSSGGRSRGHPGGSVFLGHPLPLHHLKAGPDTSPLHPKPHHCNSLPPPGPRGALSVLFKPSRPPVWDRQSQAQTLPVPWGQARAGGKAESWEHPTEPEKVIMRGGFLDEGLFEWGFEEQLGVSPQLRMGTCTNVHLLVWPGPLHLICPSLQ